MSAVLLNKRELGWIVEGAADVPVTPRETPAAIGGRGDARLAAYGKKPKSETRGPDWASLGYATLAAFLEGDVKPWLALEPSDDPLRLQGSLDGVERIAIHFPKLADGRGYSLAALLRGRLRYRGELRAVGDVLRDQVFAFARIGFDAIELRADQDGPAALKAIRDFTAVYQSAADGRAPLLARERAS